MEHADLESLGVEFVARWEAAGEAQRGAMRAEGVELADRLRREAIDLAQSRATEFSPRIPRYHLLAAQVALLAHRPGSQALDVYERDFRYYRIFESTQALVDDYEQFRAAHTGERSEL